MTTIDNLFTVQARQNEIWRRIKAGSLDIDDVLAATQGILDGIYPLKPAVTHVLAKQPSWYISPEQQLVCVKQLNSDRAWGFQESDIPSIPKGFTPRTPTEVLMLAVYLPDMGKIKELQRTFDQLWDAIQVPDGFSKYRWNDLKSDSHYLWSAHGHTHKPGIRWVAFDPNAYRGKSPEQARELAQQDNVQLAGLEGLMAALLFPTWATSWNGTDSPFPNLSGLQYNWNSDWSDVPYLDRCDYNRQLVLDAEWAGIDRLDWASPTVREC